MITGDSAAASAGRIVILDHCAAASAIIRHSDIHWTAKASTGLAFERANVCAVTASCIRDVGIVRHAGGSALIGLARQCGNCVVPALILLITI